MDGTQERPRTALDDADVPLHLADALDRSADDLRHGRVEDARSVLARLECRLDDHLARKRTTPTEG